MKTIAIYFLPFIFLLSACNSNPEAKATAEGEIQDDLKKDSLVEYCYRMEQPFKDEKGTVDYLEMRLVFNEDDVTGHYNWLPTYKDQRQGSIIGKLYDSIVLAKYYFEQEGISDTAALEILLKKNGIIVTSDRKELGLDASLPMVDCAEKPEK